MENVEVRARRSREIRGAATVRGIQIRENGDGTVTFEGYAAVFDTPYSITDWMGEYEETFHYGAFTKTLAERDDVRLLVNHEDLPLARTKSGTLRLTQDRKGLKVEATLEATDPDVQRIVPKLLRGDLAEMSIAMKVIGQTWSEDYTKRDVFEVRLYDVSIVTYAASDATSASLRGIDLVSRLAEWDPRELETELRSAGEDTDEIVSRARAVLEELGRPERRYDQVTAYVGRTPWAIHPHWLSIIVKVIAERRSGHRPTREEIRSRLGGREVRATDTLDTPHAPATIAVIPISGTIMPKASVFEETSSSGTSVEQLQAAFRAAVNDPEVSAILFDIDSPGGSVELIPELASEIFAARGSKPIVAIANTMAASAAYWIGSAAEKLYVTPSGEVGSIGVYTAHEDLSGKLAQEGISTTLVSAGEYKVEGNPFEPLSDDARAELQRGVDAFYAMFVGAVAEQRGVSPDTVEADFGQGRMALAADAVDRGMADGVATLEQVLEELAAAAPAEISAEGAARRDKGSTIATEMAERTLELLKLGAR